MFVSKVGNTFSVALFTISPTTACVSVFYENSSELWQSRSDQKAHKVVFVVATTLRPISPSDSSGLKQPLVKQSGSGQQPSVVSRRLATSLQP